MYRTTGDLPLRGALDFEHHCWGPVSHCASAAFDGELANNTVVTLESTTGAVALAASALTAVVAPTASSVGPVESDNGCIEMPQINGTGGAAAT